MNLFFSDTIAGAIAREIRRGGDGSVGYKAALVRQIEAAANTRMSEESSKAIGDEFALQLCSDAARDAHLMNELTAARLNEAPAS